MLEDKPLDNGHFVPTFTDQTKKSEEQCEHEQMPLSGRNATTMGINTGQSGKTSSGNTDFVKDGVYQLDRSN